MMIFLMLLVPLYQASDTRVIKTDRHEGEHSAISVSADGRYIARDPTGAIVTEVSSLEIWDSQTGERVYHAPGNALYFSWSPLSPAQFLLVLLADGGDTQISIYDLAAEKIIFHAEDERYRLWHPSGWLVTSHTGGEDWFRSPENFEVIFQITPPSYKEPFLSPDGRYAAYTGEQTVIYEIVTGDVIQELEVVDDLVFSADSSHVVTRQQADLQVYALADPTPLAETSLEMFGGCGGLVEMTWYDNHQHLLINASSGSVWDYTTGSVTTLAGRSSLSPDNRWLAVTLSDRLEIYAADSLTLIYTLGSPRSQVTWSPDSRWLLAYGYDGLARLYDLSSGTRLGEAPHYSDFGACSTILFPPAWSPNSDFVVTYEFSSPTAFRVGSRGRARVMDSVAETSLTQLPLFPQPDFTMQPVGSLADGAKAVVLSLGDTYGWYEVQTDTGLRGWVYEARLNTTFQLIQSLPSNEMHIWYLPADQ